MQRSSNQTITMENFRRGYNEEIHALWRGRAGDKVPYTEDFPAPILCATEFSDNSIGKGQATKVEFEFDITNPLECEFRTCDNGVGVQRQCNLVRTCRSGSINSSDANHQYGMGRIRGMTAFLPDYESAQWSMMFKISEPNTHGKIGHPWSTCEFMQQNMQYIPFTE